MTLQVTPSYESPLVYRGGLLVFRPILVGLSAILLIVSTVVFWSFTAPLASSVIATGTVTFRDRVKSVRSFEGGVVREVLVKEGDRVRRNAPLLSFETSTQEAAIKSLEMSLVLDGAQEARLRSEIEGVPEVTFPTLMHSIPSAGYGDVLRDQKRQFAIRLGALNLHQREVSLENESLKGSEDALLRQGSEIQRRLALQAADTGATSQLARQGVSSQRAQRDGESNLAILRGSLAEVEGREVEVRQQMNHNFVEMTRLGLLAKEADEADLNKLLVDSEEVFQRLQQARLSLNRAVVVSPEDGTVMSLNVYAAGAVVAPGGLIMEIAPPADHVVVETEIRPADVRDVQTGAPVRIRSTSDRFEGSPDLLGRVTYVSPDRVSDREKDDSYFIVRVDVAPDAKTDYMLSRLHPGEPVEVMILKHPTTFLSYLLKPALVSLDKAMRE